MKSASAYPDYAGNPDNMQFLKGRNMNKFKDFSEYLEPFVEEVNKYAKGVHQLNKGVESIEIDELERKLGIKFPLAYKCLLMTYNGGELFAIPAGTVLAEVYVPANGEKVEGIPYLDESFNKERRWPDMSSDLLIIADTCDGDSICIDFSYTDEYDAKIVKWSHEEGNIISSWDKLIDWLMEELEIGGMITNYDGTDKE